MTFEEFKKRNIKYELRFDTLPHKRDNTGWVVSYKIYDKYAPVTPYINLNSNEATVLARVMNVEDEEYLRRVFDWLYPSTNIYGLHDD